MAPTFKVFSKEEFNVHCWGHGRSLVHFFLSTVEALGLVILACLSKVLVENHEN
jgi:hypothetical protein